MIIAIPKIKKQNQFHKQPREFSQKPKLIMNLSSFDYKADNLVIHKQFKILSTLRPEIFYSNNFLLIQHKALASWIILTLVTELSSHFVFSFKKHTWFFNYHLLTYQYEFITYCQKGYTSISVYLFQFHQIYFLYLYL